MVINVNYDHLSATLASGNIGAHINISKEKDRCMLLSFCSTQNKNCQQ
jgi:hypothetical protein